MIIVEKYCAKVVDATSSEGFLICFFVFLSALTRIRPAQEDIENLMRIWEKYSSEQGQLEVQCDLYPFSFDIPETTSAISEQCRAVCD